MPLEQHAEGDSWRIFRIMSEFVEGFDVLGRVGQAVSIFGSARTKPDDPYFAAAEQTARLLAKRNIAVITGGGPGIMEAGNKGAIEAGGKSIGLNISLPQEQEGNKYQTISLDFHYFYARKVMFVKYASAFICFPGGYGTLDEFFEVLTLVQTLKIEAFPIILYGTPFWSGLIEWLKSQLREGHFVDREDIDIFRVVDDPEHAVALVVEGMKKPWWRPLDEELNKATGAEDAVQKKSPLEGYKASETGEGTRYGRRPKIKDKTHIESKNKPQQ